MTPYSLKYILITWDAETTKYVRNPTASMDPWIALIKNTESGHLELSKSDANCPFRLVAQILACWPTVVKLAVDPTYLYR